MVFFKCSKFSTTKFVLKKKNWQLLFENAIKKKKRGGNLNYKTHPVVLFSSVSVTKKKRKEQNKDNF